MGDLLLLVDGASGALYMGLAVLVAAVRPRTAGSSRLAAFCLFFGAAYLSANWRLYALFALGTPQGDALLWVAGASFAICGGALVAFALATPGLAPKERRMAWIAAIVGAAIAVTGAVVSGLISSTSSALLDVFFGANFLLRGAFVFALVLWALQFRSSAAGATERRSHLALLSGGLVLFPAVESGVFLGTRSQPEALLAFGAAPAAGILVASGVWLVATHASPDSRAARNVALWSMLALATGFVIAMLASPTGQLGGTNGVARTLGIAVLAYAILRHKLLGLDARVRFVVKGTTIAAAFVGLFFVVSEAAQQFFGERLGSQYLGIAAAGCLAFGLAPLQRVADRLARTAVPDKAARAPDPEEVYGHAVRLATQRGEPDDAEEVALAQLANRLGLTAGRAARLRATTRKRTR